MPRGFGPVPGAPPGGSSSPPTTSFRPSRGSRRTQPRERCRRDRGGTGSALDDDAIAAALTSFAGVAHRLELVGEVGGVQYVNDSKATNTAAARRALTSYDVPLHLILGGRAKGEGWEELAQEVSAANVVTAYLIGEAAEPLSVALAYENVPFLLSVTLERAVAEAASAAQPGEIVLLSPACASYDEFRDFEHRGEEFRRLVENLQG